MCIVGLGTKHVFFHIYTYGLHRVMLFTLRLRHIIYSSRRRRFTHFYYIIHVDILSLYVESNKCLHVLSIHDTLLQGEVILDTY